MTSDTNHEQDSMDEADKIQVGDLVRVRDYDWLSQEVGIVTEVKCLVHAQSGAEYTAVTAMMGHKPYTFSSQDFELISKAERKEVD